MTLQEWLEIEWECVAFKRRRCDRCKRAMICDYVRLALKGEHQPGILVDTDLVLRCREYRPVGVEPVKKIKPVHATAWSDLFFGY